MPHQTNYMARPPLLRAVRVYNLNVSSPLDVENPDLLSVRSVTKFYGKNCVLDNVSFTLKRGEIHALLGENGAGKTTLMNVLRGLTQPNSGQIIIDGAPVQIKTPLDSSRSGIGMVHQHFLLVPAFTVEENLILAGQQHGFLIDQRSIKAKADQICTKLAWNIPYTSRVSDLTVGVQQRVEILKALLGDARIVLFDEPTAVLTPNEVDDLLVVLRALRDEGRSLVFVSHKLGEVMALCDRVTVLRRGHVVGQVAVSDTSPADLARRMVGDDSAELLDEEMSVGTTPRGPGISVSRIEAPRTGKDDVALRDVTFDVGAGQILGVAGVDGNGQEELFELLVGLRKYSSGTISVAGAAVTNLRPSSLTQLGIAVIPPDRQRQGLALSMSIRDNLLFDEIGDKRNRRLGILANRRLDKLALQLRDEFDVRTPDISLPVSSLSGGNQQKIVIARALSKKPAIVLAASPTRGLDVAAAAYVHAKLRKCRDDGAAIILISTELDEVTALADKIAILYEGRIAAIVTPKMSRKQLGLLMGGKSLQESGKMVEGS